MGDSFQDGERKGRFRRSQIGRSRTVSLSARISMSRLSCPGDARRPRRDGPGIAAALAVTGWCRAGRESEVATPSSRNRSVRLSDQSRWHSCWARRGNLGLNHRGRGRPAAGWGSYRPAVDRLLCGRSERPSDRQLFVAVILRALFCAPSPLNNLNADPHGVSRRG
jgi:hypothetical protein